VGYGRPRIGREEPERLARSPWCAEAMIAAGGNLLSDCSERV
jgi:hypothetical protein